MVVLLDTDAVSHWSNQPRFRTDIDLLHKSKVFLTVPETVVKEIIRNTDPLARARLSKSLATLLDARPVLAGIWRQTLWGVQRFLSGESTFKPFIAVGADALKKHLRNGGALRNGALETLHEEKRNDVRTWETMHEKGRLRFQEVLEKNKPIPDAATLIAMMLKSNVFRDLILERTSDHTQRELLSSRWQDYVAWNPVFRCFLELFILAIRRHTMEPENASSKKGPKWADYSIGAFVGIADRLVTDDKRLRNALDQHRHYRGITQWESVSLDQFLGQLRGGNLSNDLRQTLEVWTVEAQES